MFVLFIHDCKADFSIPRLQPVMFLGAASSFTFDQRQIDVIFTPGLHVPLPRRLVHTCIGLGVAFLHTEARLGWVWGSGPAAGLVEVHDRGPSVHPPLPFPGVACPPVVIIAGGAAVPLLTAGFLLEFGQRLVISHVPPVPQNPFTYVPHHRPQPHMEMVPVPNGVLKPFTNLWYGGQVQNWRQGI